MEEQCHTALLIIDMQNAFLNPNSSLCVAGGRECLPKVIQAVDAARKHRVMPIIWIIREHHPSGIDVERFRTHLYSLEDPQKSPLRFGAPDTAFPPGLSPAPHEITIVKKRFSAFFSTNLDLILRRLGTKHVVLAGVQTPNCIRQTAFDALSLDYHLISVLKDATASATKEVQESNLHDMRNVGIQTPSVDEWVEQLSKFQSTGS